MLIRNGICSEPTSAVNRERMFSGIFMIFLSLNFVVNTVQNDFCDVNESDCNHPVGSLLNVRYIFYDVNPPEGFNLRRDVYLRMAIFAKRLKAHLNSYVVLPPWPNLYHWQSEDITGQMRLPWSLFFDLKSLQSFAPVIEMSEFFKTGIKTIDQVYVLQHFEDMFKTGNFEDRMRIEACSGKIPYRRADDSYIGFFWGYRNITAKKVDCLSFHGSAPKLIDVVLNDKARTLLFDHAEVALHDRFADKEYWDARKSVRFARHLIDEAEKYQAKYLNWTRERDGNPWPNLRRTAVGGSYLAVHLRRKDFLFGHRKDVPSIEDAAKQIDDVLNKLKLNVVFVATDASKEEKLQLKNGLPGRKVFTYTPSDKVKAQWKDGGIAIIEQIICSNARYFIGTHESTFSFTIREEREIMGFRPETTFQRFCGDKETKCKEATRWLIVH